MDAAKKVRKYHNGSSHVGLKSQNDSLSLLVSPALALFTLLSLYCFIVHASGL